MNLVSNVRMSLLTVHPPVPKKLMITKHVIMTTTHKVSRMMNQLADVDVEGVTEES